MKAIRNYYDIPGWFWWNDRALFDAVLDAQTEPGDLVELGAYLGRSAVIVGDHLRPGERFVIVDLFGDENKFGGDQRDVANRIENQQSYESLTRQEFEANYLALHAELPVVIQGFSSEVVEHVAPGSARFVHIDASHLYDQVAEDIRNAKQLLRSDGVVVFDDYRSEHTPGVSAAVWAAVANDGLRPFALTGTKLYGTWGDPAPWLEVVRRLAAREERFTVSEETIMGAPVMRFRAQETPAPPAPPHVTDAELDKIAAKVADIVDAKQQERAKARAQAKAAAQAQRTAPTPDTAPALARKLARRVAGPAVRRVRARVGKAG